MNQPAQFHDTDRKIQLLHQVTAYRGAIWDVRRDTFRLSSQGQPLTREYLSHPGAVAIVAMNDRQHIAMFKQYRHPVGQDCWEIPAGLVDVDGESLLSTAQRELAEEVDLTAVQWSVLIDHYPSGGSSAEHIRIFLAQELTEIAAHQRFNREAEEAEITLHWVPLTTALHAVMSGAIKNSNTVAGVMAAHLVVSGQHPARPVDTANDAL